MTSAICLGCGGLKLGSFIACPDCGFVPSSDIDLAYSMALSDHYFDKATLTQISDSMKSGNRRPSLPKEQEEEFLKAVKSPYFQRIMGFAATPHQREDLASLAGRPAMDDNGKVCSKPIVLCPYCDKSFSAGQLISQRLQRTLWGIDIFACPHCNGHIKVDPAEAMLVTDQLRANRLPEGSGIVAYKVDELTPSEKRAQSSSMSANELTNRAQTFRSAGRMLRYRVYVAIEGTWILLALYAVGRDVFVTHDNTQITVLALLVALSLAHSGKMTLTQPWQFLNAILLGAIAYAAGRWLFSFVGALSNPTVYAVVIGSGYYFWLGELWTRREATLNEERYLIDSADSD